MLPRSQSQKAEYSFNFSLLREKLLDFCALIFLSQGVKQFWRPLENEYLYVHVINTHVFIYIQNILIDKSTWSKNNSELIVDNNISIQVNMIVQMNMNQMKWMNEWMKMNSSDFKWNEFQMKMIESLDFGLYDTKLNGLLYYI